MSIDLTPGSPEWQKRITASKVAAILGVSPWQSPYSLWCEMKGWTSRPDTTDAQRRGHYLEHAILAWWRDRHPEYADWREQHPRLLGEWAAATPDMEVWREEQCLEEEAPDALVEAKSVARDDEWGQAGTDQIPAYYLAQTVFQMLVSSVGLCYVPIITGRLEFREYVVRMEDYADDARLIEARCREFYDSLAGDNPPELDASVATFETLKRLHPDIDLDLTAEATAGEAREYVEAELALKDAEARARAARSVVLDRMGKARYLAVDGFRVARRQPNKTGVSLVRTCTDPNLIAESEVA